MTHHSFAVLTVDLVVGVTPKNATSPGGGAGPQPAGGPDPDENDVKRALKAKLGQQKFEGYDIRSVEIKGYKRM